MEITTIFNNRSPAFVRTAFDADFSRLVQRMWINFAKRGDPTVPAEESPTGQEVRWDPYSTAEPNTMVLNEKGIRQGTDVVDGFLDRRFLPFMKFYAK